MQSNNLPQVSVIIPTFNRANYVIEAIHSALDQTYSNIEVILVDDGSTDNTRKLIQQLDDNRLMYYYQSNQGRSAARNFGAQIARGDLLGFLDSDDLYLPDTIQNHIQIFSENPDLGMTIGGYEYIDEEGNVFASRDPWVTGARINLDNWLFDCFAIPGSIFLRKDWFEKAGGFDKSFDMAEDWLLFMQLALLDCPMDWVRQVVCRYRQHSDNSTQYLEAHRLASHRALENVFKNITDLQSLELKNRSAAWVNIIFARKSLHAGFTTQTVHYLKEAFSLDPSYAEQDKIQVLEFLLKSSPGLNNEDQILIDLKKLDLTPYLVINSRDIRRARSRVEMSEFFQEMRYGDQSIAKIHLIKGVIFDPQWLLNRGVLKLGLRSFF